MKTEHLAMKTYNLNALSDHIEIKFCLLKKQIKFIILLSVNVPLINTYHVAHCLTTLSLYCRFVGRFMSRRERLEVLDLGMRKFNNVYVKNLS